MLGRSNSKLTSDVQIQPDSLAANVGPGLGVKQALSLAGASVGAAERHL